VQSRWDSFQAKSQTSSLDSSGSTKFITKIIGASVQEPTPVPLSKAPTNQLESDSSMMDFATPAASVSAFCRAVLNHLMPLSLFGTGVEGLTNRRKVMRSIDQFIKLRKKETLSLHDVCQGLKVIIHFCVITLC